MQERFRWQIECNHTAETIDRIILPIRKRGIAVSSFQYTQKDASHATCLIEFEIEASAVERVYKNMIRIQDINEVIKL